MTRRNANKKHTEMQFSGWQKHINVLECGETEIL